MSLNHARLVSSATAVIVSAMLLGGQTPPAEVSGTVIRSNVREVLLDVVVRRKNLSLARNLKSSDFHVTEDGVPQTIKTFRFVSGREARILPQPPSSIGPAVRSAAPEANSMREPNFVSIIFDQIGPDSRKNAIEAATDFLDQEFQTNTYAAVFGLNLRLSAVQGFTNDRTLLKNAVRRAVSANSMELARASAGVLNQTDVSISGGIGGITVSTGVDLTQRPDMATGSASEAPLSEARQALAGMISAQRDMVAYGAGMQVATGLLRVVQYESKLPGRKTVLYLSEGLTKPPERDDLIRTVVGAANRGNVTFYCVDVRGLTAGSSNGAASGLTQTAAGISRTQGVMSSSPSGAMRQAQQFDVISDSLAAHAQLAMAELAEGTGGFAVFNTSDFKNNMARMMEDVRIHYEISYVPAATEYDGHFRRIKVTVDDPNLIVQTRDGYFAVPDLGGQPVLPFEMAGLRALNGGSRRDFEFHCAALRFKPLAGGYRYEMGFDVDTGSLTTPLDSATHRARIHVTFLALLKDAAGQVVNRVSREIDREVPEDRLEQFRRGRIVFTTPFEADSGRYTIEAAVTDPQGGRSSTRRLSLFVPKPGSPAISSISLVRRLDPLGISPRDPGNPFEFSNGSVSPALNQAVAGSGPATLFFVVYPRVEGNNVPAEKPKVIVEYFRDGKLISRTQPDAGTPDEVNSFPMIESTTLPPGDYLVRITAEQAGRASQESMAITVNP